MGLPSRQGLPAAARSAFLAQWQDPKTEVVWRYHLLYYPGSQEVELYDVKNRRTFLKRMRVDGIMPQHLRIGARVLVCARQLEVLDYADAATRRQLHVAQERTLAMVKPDAMLHLGAILDAIYQAGFQIAQMRMAQLGSDEAAAFYAVHQGRPFYDRLVQFMSSGPVVAMELVAKGAIARWRQLLGPTDSEAVRREAPSSLRARFGTDQTFNACHGSDAPDAAAQEIVFFFKIVPPVGRLPRTSSNCTLALIKPHAVQGGLAGRIIAAIQGSGGFEVAALQQLSVGAKQAAGLLEVYRGLVPPGELSWMVNELTSGPCIALEIAQTGDKGPHVVETFRELCGPTDPEVARLLRPQSLRAQFGTTKVQNAVHCTDLPEDGVLEVDSFFHPQHQPRL